jgi:catechol 2,3-dioxygenase-like lactoylglutathione lyase family enzyme
VRQTVIFVLMTDKLRLEGLTLTVESVKRSLDFYSGKLGLKVEWDALPAFAMIRHGACTLGLLTTSMGSTRS